MMRSTAKSFYQRYFSATQEASWLARLMAGRQQENSGGTDAVGSDVNDL